MPSLDHMGGEIGVVQADAFTCWIANTRIDNALRGCGVKALAQILSLVILVGIESLGSLGMAAAQIVEIALNIEPNFPKLRRPARRLRGVGHEAGMVVGRLEQCCLKFTGYIEHPEGSPAETGRPVGAHMRERRHEVTRPG